MPTDSIDSLKHWWLFSKLEENSIYANTHLGRLWENVSFALFVLAIGGLYGAVLDQPAVEYLPYFAVGYLGWTILSSAVSGGCRVYLNAAKYIKEYTHPPHVYVFVYLFKLIRTSIKNLAIVFVILIFVGVDYASINYLAVIFSFFSILAYASSLVFLFGVFSSRFNDVIYLTDNLLRALFFLTPILWVPNQREWMRWLVELNPFYYHIQSIRNALIGQVLDYNLYVINVGITVIAILLAYMFYARSKDKIIYWL